MQAALQVENLGKQYRLGKEVDKNRTLGETVGDALASPFRTMKTSFGKLSEDEESAIWALRGVSFRIDPGEVVGVIGRNGAGKSTLLKILARITEPTEGSARVRGRISSLLEVGTGFHQELTGRENVYLNGAILGMARSEIESKFEEIVAFAEVERFIDTPVKRYSSGMRMRLAFSVAAHLETDIMLIDEVLAVGDLAFQRKCLGKMDDVARGGRTVLFVSHNMEAVASLCSRSLLIEEGEVRLDGPTETALGNYYELLGEKTAQSASHVLYEDPGPPGGSPRVTRVEMLDSAGSPVESANTWDGLTFRVHTESQETLQQVSIILEIRDQKQQRLVVLDSGAQFPIPSGPGWVDCTIDRFPLPAGDFIVGVGIGLPSGGWVWRQPNLAPMRVGAADVLRLGRPPTYSRMLFVVPARWRPAPPA